MEITSRMASKKRRRVSAIKAKKKRRYLKFLFLTFIILCGVVFILFFAGALKEYLYSPESAKSGVHTSRNTYKATLYFSDSNERFLVPEVRYLPKKMNVADQVADLVRALIKGPNTKLIETFPRKTTLKGVEIKGDGTALINFERDLVTLHPGGSASEIMTIYSLTNTITLNVPSIQKVKILIDGKEAETLKGHIDIRDPFTTNSELIVEGA